MSVAGDVAGLTADAPLVMFPVRLETRFHPIGAPDVVRVRIYPDAVLADAHEPALTATERAAGERYWTAVTADPPAAPGAWSALLEEYPAPRAAWLVRATDPAAADPPAQRDGSWTRAVVARALPDRWFVAGYRFDPGLGRLVEVTRAESLPVVTPLALTLTPDPDGPAGTVPVAGLDVDPAAAWAFDFTRALQAGMAVELPLPADDPLGGFDRVVAVGVAAGVPPHETGAVLGRLLDAHHYTRGLAVVPQGTPTNNVTAGPSGFPPPDPRGEVSFAVEQDVGEPSADVADLLAALGLTPAEVDPRIGDGRPAGHPRAGERPAAAAMADVLWPATIGYFLEQAMAPVFDDAMIAAARRYVVDTVHGRGPAPALRVGGTPYGVLPVSSLDRWGPARPGHALVTARVARLDRTWPGRVAAVARRDRLEVVARDTDGLLHRWTGIAWAPLEAPAAGDPAAAVDQAGIVHVVARGNGGALIHVRLNGDAVSVDVDDTAALTGDPVVAAAGTRVDVVAAGPRGRLVHRQLLPRGPRRPHWTELAGDDATDPALAARAPGLVDLVAQRGDMLVHRVLTDVGRAPTAWSDWTEVGLHPEGPVALVATEPASRQEPGRIVLIAPVGGRLAWLQHDRSWSAAEPLEGSDGLDRPTAALLRTKIGVVAATAVGELRQTAGVLGPSGPQPWSSWTLVEPVSHAVSLRTGRDVGSDGAVGSAWTGPAPVPGGIADLAGGVALATADLTGSGRPDLVVGAVRSGGRLGYRVGFELDGEGAATAGWSGIHDVPLPEPARPTAGCAIALLPGADGRSDLVVVFASATAPGDTRYAVGRGLDTVGNVTGGWSLSRPLPFPADGAFAGATVVGGRLVVGAVTGGAVDLLVSDPLAPDGSAPGWAPPLRVPWPDPVTAAAVAALGDDLVILVANTVGTRYAVGRSLGIGGWSAPLPVPAAPAGTTPGRLVGIGLTIPALGVRPVVGDRIAGTLRTLRDAWLRAARDVPHVGRTGDPDTDLLEVLGLDASAREVRVRPVLGGALIDNLAQLYGTTAFGMGSGQAWQKWLAEARRRVDDALRAVGPPAWNPAADARAWDPRLGRMVAGEDAPRFAHALVAVHAATDVPLSETDPLAPENYVDWLLAHGGDVGELRRAWRGLVGERPPLLAILLRQALLLEHARVGADLLGLDPVERRERELHGMPVVTAAPGGGTQTAVPPTVWDRFASEVPGTGRTVAETLATLWTADDGPYASYRASLEVLRDLPTAELQRVFTEALDVASHRIDAWITAMAADRLRELRRLRAGNHLAAFGWVEGLRPADPDRYTGTSVDDARAFVQRDGGGHVHAPSLAHAAAAAVLRNAHLTRSGEDGRRYAVDLSSARVRAARDLLNAVRDGGSLGEVLGSRVERGLRRRSATGPPEASLERFVDALRDRFPLVAGKIPAPAGAPDAPPAAAAARTILDGLALRAAWHAGTVDVGALTGGHAAAPALRDALGAEVAVLDAVLDATTDLLTADGVYQLVRGNPPAAAASLDALARGVRPPDPDIAQTPRGGTAVTHRVLLVLGPAAHPWPAAATPRAELEPSADGWLADLVGDPATVRCRTRTTVAGVTTTRTVTLADLGLRPMDLLAIVRGGTAELDRRIVWEARQAAAVPLGPDDPDPDVAVLHVPAPGRDPAVERTFPEVLEVLRAADAVLTAARPLRPADLVPPHEADAAGSANVRGTEALTRAQAVRGHMDDLLPLLDAALAGLGPAAGPPPQPPPGAMVFTAARAALRRAALLGFPGAFPVGHEARREADRAELAAQVASVRAEAARRLAAVPPAPAAAATEAERADAATALVTAVLGPDAVFLPTLMPPGAAELAQALAGGPAALGPAPAATMRAWTQQVGRVRPAMDRWRRLGLYAETAGRPLTLGIAQLPFHPGEPWTGRQGVTVPAGRLSLVLHRHATPAAGAVWAGVLLDEWTELVPNAEELTGIAFHYDDPGAEAPQAILVAVPPDGSATWNLDIVLAVLHETLDLAKVRAVDAELVGGLGHLLPMTLLAANHAGDTIASDFTRMRRGG